MASCRPDHAGFDSRSIFETALIEDWKKAAHPLPFLSSLAVSGHFSRILVSWVNTDFQPPSCQSNTSVWHSGRSKDFSHECARGFYLGRHDCDISINADSGVRK